MTPSERRFAPTTVRQARNGVRYGLEQVSAFIGIRNSLNRLRKLSEKRHFADKNFHDAWVALKSNFRLFEAGHSGV